MSCEIQSRRNQFDVGLGARDRQSIAPEPGAFGGTLIQEIVIHFKGLVGGRLWADRAVLSGQNGHLTDGRSLGSLSSPGME